MRRYGIDGAKPRALSQVAAEMNLRLLVIASLAKWGEVVGAEGGDVN